MPHSEIPGSPIARISPGLFAACHVLPRLSVPRHPPDALLIALDCHHAARAQGQNPGPASAGAGIPVKTGPKDAKRPRMKTLPRTAQHSAAARAAPAAGPVRLGHMTTPSSPFNQHTAPGGSARTGAHSKPSATTAGASRPAAAAGCGGASGGGGGERIRTDDLLLAKQALSQLSYTPVQGSENRHQGSELLIPDY